MPDTEMFHDNNGLYIYKVCIVRSKYSMYDQLFDQECKSMQALYNKDPIHYLRYFAKYHEHRTDSFKRPYIKMDYVCGKTLENILCENRHLGNHNHLTDRQTLHLFEQLDEAQHMLRGIGIMHLDLNPANIIVLNDDFDIKLVDLTGACHFNGPKRGYSLIDYHADVGIAPALQLRQAGALLFTRLFYSGNRAYLEYDWQSFLKTHGRYRLLLQCLKKGCTAEDTEDPMFYWSLWIAQLKSTLS